MPLPLDELRRLFERRVRREPAYPGSRLERGLRTVRLIEGERGWLSWSDLGDLAPGEIDEVIRAEIARFRELGLVRKFEWKLYGSDRPWDLRERLVAHGFEPKEPLEAVLVLDLSDLPPELRSSRGHDIRLVLPDEAGLEATRRIMEAVWPEEDADEALDFIRASMLAEPSATTLWLAYVGGRPVAEGRLDLSCHEFAGLYGGATLPAYRRRGIYTALVAARAAEALRRGARFLTIDASPMSRAVLEKRGFVLLDTAQECDYRGG